MPRLQPIPDGFGPSEEHIRVLEAYRREHDIPISLPYSTPAFNRAVDRWNAEVPSPEPAELCDEESGDPFDDCSHSCELPKGHDGDHRATYEWRQSPPPAPREPRESIFLPPGWGAMLTERLRDRMLPNVGAAFQREQICIPTLRLPRDDDSTPREGNPHG